VVNETMCTWTKAVAHRRSFAEIASTAKYASTIIIGYKCNETAPLINTLFATMKRPAILMIDGPRDAETLCVDGRSTCKAGGALSERIQFERLQYLETVNVLMLYGTNLRRLDCKVTALAGITTLSHAAPLTLLYAPRTHAPTRAGKYIVPNAFAHLLRPYPRPTLDLSPPQG
jgi:hypothetical protein